VEEIVGKLYLSGQYCNCIQERLGIAKQKDGGITAEIVLSTKIIHSIDAFLFHFSQIHLLPLTSS